MVFFENLKNKIVLSYASLNTTDLVVLVPGQQGDIVEALVLLLILAAIPAMIANSKGRQPLLWYVYALIIPPIAFVHALLLKKES